MLGIETSGYANAIGVVDGDRILADFNFSAKADSLEKIILDIDFALKKSGLNLRDIQGIGVGLGPGSWTGIRVGITVGKILAYSASKLICGVPTLEVLAYQARDTHTLICPIISTGAKDTVYAAFYRPENDIIKQIGEYYVGDLPGLARMVREPVVFIGAEAKVYHQLISQALGSPGINLEAREVVPSGAMVALLAEARLESGEGNDPLPLEPLYLKEPTAKAFLSRSSRSAQV